jgi:hypothetical protein
MTTLYARAAGGNWNAAATWSLSSGGGADGTVPTAADDVRLDASSGAVNINAASACRSLNCTGYTNTLTHTAAMLLSIGDATAGAGGIALLLAAAMTYTLGAQTTSAISFVSTAATQQTIATNGKTLGTTTVAGVGSSYLNVGLLTTGTGANMALTNGTFHCGTTGINVNSIASATDNVRTFNPGSGSLTLRGSGVVPNFGIDQVNLSIPDHSAIVYITDVTATAKQFIGGTRTWNQVVITGGANSGTMRFNGADTFKVCPQIIGGIKTISFLVGRTFTLANSNDEGFGNGTNQITIGLSSAGAAATFSKPGGVFKGDYLAFNDNSTPGLPILIASGGASFYAGSHSTQVSTNPGFIFADAPVVTILNPNGFTKTGGTNKRIVVTPVNTNTYLLDGDAA